MFWKLDALTAIRAKTSQVIEGSLEDVNSYAAVYDLEIISIRADYVAYIKIFFIKRNLSSAQMAEFFCDFADMQRCGLSSSETVSTLMATTSLPVLKNALRKIGNYIHDGRSLQESFENTRIFPKIVSITLSSAEKSGNIPELLDVLSKYFEYKNESLTRFSKAMFYPFLIICGLTGVSIFVSINLIPKLKLLLPPSATNSISAYILIGYSDFMRSYWWGVVLVFIAGIFYMKRIWDNHRDKLMEILFRVPLFGDLLKNMELSNLFLGLYVYQKSGVTIIETIKNIHQASHSYVSGRLMLVQERIINGASLGDAFKQDNFFPMLIVQNISKAEKNGFLPQYFKRIHEHYDKRSKSSMDLMLKLIEPTLLVLSGSFLLLIVCTFILPIYTGMSSGQGVFK